MKEKIGQVTLDYTWYPGQDFYSDGAVEEEMLAVARDNPPGDYNQVIARKKSWPILYHFSHIRENIVSWLPFTGQEQVLEIGSGCGAVTGALCARAKEVTCIELSKKRSTINAYRNRDAENLTILVGNFQDIEKNLTQTYDYITLIGVFEYGESYIDSTAPYEDFLKIVSRHLKPQGKIVVAIENRLGLKYWAGCTEDHFGTLFEGLEGYPSTKGVKTFSKKELEGILRAAGNLKAQYYYPCPDYKFPMAIYSPWRLPARGELGKDERNFDRLRLHLFQESAVYDTLLDNGLFQQFSNSFLLLISKEEPRDTEKTVYAKFSNERDKAFAIRTDICLDPGGQRVVRKVPADARARSHVRHIKRSAKLLEGLYETEGLQVNACALGQEEARLEYLWGETLEERLDALLAQGRLQELEDLLFDYVEKVRRIHSQEAFTVTEGFLRVFGPQELPQGLLAAPVSNIDLVPGNLILGDYTAWVIDYEWTFEFPIPAHFLMYRMLHYYLESDGKRQVLKGRGFYEKAGITLQEQEIYGRMEESFQKYMLGSHVPMTAMYEDISPGQVEVLPYYDQVRVFEADRQLQVFFNRGEGFLESESLCYPLKNKGLYQEIPIPQGTGQIRLDPGEAAGGVLVKALKWKDGSAVNYETNGFDLGQGRLYFGSGDPQILISQVPANVHVLVVQVQPIAEKEAREEFWNCYDRSVREKDAEIRKLRRALKQREQLIQEMENTKVWKLYRTLKRDGK